MTIGRDRPLFYVALDPLPPVPWQDGPPQGEGAADLLEDLLAAAGSTVIAPLAEEPDAPLLGEGLDAIKAACAAYDAAPGIGLADYLWTHHSALRNGEIAARLRHQHPDGHQPQAFLLLYATEIRGLLLYAPGASPLRVRQLIGAAPDVEGPHLALVVLERSADGRVEPALAVTTPIYHARRLMPVRSALDRDVLRALKHFQVALDVHGVDCRISRVQPAHLLAPTRLALELTSAGRQIARATIDIDPGASARRAALDQQHPSFVVCDRTWRDDSLIEWLTRIVCD